jgi:hypothetical protein
MKKQLLNLSFVAIALGLYVSTAFSTPVPPVRLEEIPATVGAMVQDGMGDEDSYSPLMGTTIFNATGLTGGDQDFKADIKLSWDWNYLYLYAEISDDIEEDYNWGVGNSYEFDNLEVFLQLDTNTVTTSYDDHTIQLRICRELDSVESPGRAPRGTYLYDVENTATGWLTETAIPWTCVLADGEGPQLMEDYAGIEIGFDFAGADSDDSDGDPDVGNRDVQSAWDSDDPDTETDRTEDSAWNNTSVFGRIILTGDPVLVGLNDNTLSAVKVYPNPTTGELNLDVNGQVDVYNVAGTLVKSVQTLNNKINVSDLSDGIYFIRTVDGMVKFIKQ